MDGKRAIRLSYPDYGGPWGEIIRTHLDGKLDMDPLTLLFTHMSDMSKDQHNIRALLDDGCHVILDRYFTSTIAYECAKGLEFRKALGIILGSGFITPDILFIIDISPEVSMKRKAKDKALDINEKDIELLAKVRENYKILVGGMWGRTSEMYEMSEKLIAIDGMRPITDVIRDVDHELLLAMKEVPDMEVALDRTCVVCHTKIDAETSARNNGLCKDCVYNIKKKEGRQ